MGVHCYLTELGTLVTMAAKIVALVAALATVAAGEPGYGYGGVAYHSYGGSSYTHRSPQGLHGHYGGYGYHDMVRDMLRLNLDMVMDMVLLLSMSPRLTMDMDTTQPSTPMDTTLDMDMARGPLMPSLDMVTDML